MQRSVNSLVGYTINAKDGNIGKVSEFYFDDHSWTIRYLVVETGSWLNERKVLIPHSALGITDWMSESFQVNLTIAQVQNSPDIETKKTVSRQHEFDLYNYYGLPVYWGDVLNDGNIGIMPFPDMIDTTIVKKENNPSKKLKEDTHLRSTHNVEGYNIQSNDGAIGHVEDFIIDDKKWNLVFMTIDTHNWLPGKKVLISPKWIKNIDWDNKNVFVSLSRENIKNSPEFDPEIPIRDEYESELFNYYDETIKHIKDPI